MQTQLLVISLGILCCSTASSDPGPGAGIRFEPVGTAEVVCTLSMSKELQSERILAILQHRQEPPLTFKCFALRARKPHARKGIAVHDTKTLIKAIDAIKARLNVDVEKNKKWTKALKSKGKVILEVEAAALKKKPVAASQAKKLPSNMKPERTYWEHVNAVFIRWLGPTHYAILKSVLWAFPLALVLCHLFLKVLTAIDIRGFRRIERERAQVSRAQELRRLASQPPENSGTSPASKACVVPQKDATTKDTSREASPAASQMATNGSIASIDASSPLPMAPITNAIFSGASTSSAAVLSSLTPLNVTTIPLSSESVAYSAVSLEPPVHKSNTASSSLTTRLQKTSIPQTPSQKGLQKPLKKSLSNSVTEETLEPRGDIRPCGPTKQREGFRG